MSFSNLIRFVHPTIYIPRTDKPNFATASTINMTCSETKLAVQLTELEVKKLRVEEEFEVDGDEKMRVLKLEAIEEESKALLVRYETDLDSEFTTDILHANQENYRAGASHTDNVLAEHENEKIEKSSNLVAEDQSKANTKSDATYAETFTIFVMTLVGLSAALWQLVLTYPYYTFGIPALCIVGAMLLKQIVSWFKQRRERIAKIKSLRDDVLNLSFDRLSECIGQEGRAVLVLRDEVASFKYPKNCTERQFIIDYVWPSVYVLIQADGNLNIGTLMCRAERSTSL